jgi:hypothetical protein
LTNYSELIPKGQYGKDKQPGINDDKARLLRYLQQISLFRVLIDFFAILAGSMRLDVMSQNCAMDHRPRGLG